MKNRLFLFVVCLFLMGCPIDDDDDASDLDTSSDRVIYLTDKDIPNNFELFVHFFSHGISQQLNPPLPVESDVFDFIISPNQHWVIFLANSHQLDKKALFVVSSNGGIVQAISPKFKSVTKFWCTSNNEVFFVVEEFPTKTYRYQLDKASTQEHQPSSSVSLDNNTQEDDLFYILHNSSLKKQTIQNWQKYSVIY